MEPEVPTLSQTNTVNVSSPYSLNIHLLSCGIIPTKTLYPFLFWHMRSTWFAHLVLLDLITIVISGDDYKS
jgi:hypothetical protein